MKKILLSLFLVSTIVVVKAQYVVLNEVYTDPGAGKSEFIELYNSSGISENLDCYTILTYWNSGSGPTYKKGWYVIDLPNVTLSPSSWYVISSADPFNVQAQTNVDADANWNAMPVASGYLQKWEQSGATYTDVTGTMGAVTDLLVAGDFYSGTNYMTLLFKNGVFVNGFWGGGPSATLPVGITGMNDLIVTPNPTSCISPSTTFTIDFSTLGAVEFHNPSGGTDNGYIRTRDGLCGSWTKSSSGTSHTPGATNGSTGGVAGSLGTAQLINCGSIPRTITADVTSISGDLTLADDFPVIAYVYHDVNENGLIDDGTYFDTLMFQNVTDAARTTDPIPDANGDYIIDYQTKRNCVGNQVRLQTTCSTLPVKLKSFTATRNKSNVLLKWETVSEEKNKGFDVQRFIGSGNWESVGFVSSKATEGNSSSALNYEFTDINNTKGVTQYRLKQVDLDGKSSFSLIRSIRGEGQSGKTIVYPNPSNNGKVNVVFEDGNVTRDVKLIDMNGRTIKQWRGTSNNNIQIENLNAGFYSVIILNRETGEQVVEKIMVNKR